MDRKQFLTGLVAVCATAAQTAAAGDLTIDVRFSKDEISIIRAYYERASRSGRPERRSGRQLPPGIAKNLARGKPMPPGIQKTRMPDGFVSQLPHYAGHEWRQAGGDLVLVASGSLVISDILEGVFD